MPFLETAGGVLLGGAVATGTTWLADRRKARREHEQGAQRERVQRLQAARLVSDELQRVRAHYENAVKPWALLWPPSEGFKLPTEAWAQHKGTLAMADDVWLLVESAYASVYFLNAETPATPQPVDSSPAMVEDISETLASLDRALAALETFQGGATTPERPTR